MRGVSSNLIDGGEFYSPSCRQNNLFSFLGRSQKAARFAINHAGQQLTDLAECTSCWCIYTSAQTSQERLSNSVAPNKPNGGEK